MKICIHLEAERWERSLLERRSDANIFKEGEFNYASKNHSELNIMYFQCSSEPVWEGIDPQYCR